MMRPYIAVAAVGFVLVAGDEQNPPQFRSMTARVGVDVSVLSGNVPVPDLTSADFTLTDNGVPQQIEAVALAAVPVDVTLVVDVSGSTQSQVADYRRDVAAIAALLRQIDRLRIITLESAVQEILPLGPATGTVPAERIQTGRLSSVFDGLAAALLRQSDAGRRHLIVGYTDGADNRSLLTSDQMLEMGRTSEAVLHLILPSGRVPTSMETDKPCSWFQESVVLPRLPECPYPPLLQQAVEATGGRIHSGTRMVGAFTSIFRGFLNSYILYFQPTGVSLSGWHEVSVKVTKRGRYTVHARRGYFGRN